MCVYICQTVCLYGRGNILNSEAEAIKRFRNWKERKDVFMETPGTQKSSNKWVYIVHEKKLRAVSQLWENLICNK